MNNKAKRNFFIAAGLVLFALVFVVINSVVRMGERNVSFIIAPSVAELYLDGETVENNLRLGPGVYEVRVAAEGFAEYNETLVVEEDDITRAVALVPITEEAFRIADEEDDVYFIAEEAAGIASQAEALKQIEENPILEELPYKSYTYEIDYKFDEAGGLVLVVGADSEQDKGFALDKIRDLGYDPFDYEIEYDISEQ